MKPGQQECTEKIKGRGYDDAKAAAIYRTAERAAEQAGKGEDPEEIMRHAMQVCDEIEKPEAKNHSLDTLDLPDQEIFAAGTWNGDRYTEKDLDTMVEAYRSTVDTWKVPLKLSHDHPKGWPAVGWVENLRRQGNKLIGDFKRIPKTIYQMIKAGGYRQKSAEIFWGVSVNGKQYNRLLKAVALLGVDPKAVQSIGDLVTLYASGGGEAKEYEGAGEARTYDLGQKQEEDGAMDELKKQLAEAEKALAASEGKVKQFEAELAEVKKTNGDLQKRAETAEGKLAEFSQKETAREITAVIDKLIADGRLAPAKKEHAYNMLLAARATEKKYSAGGKEYSLEESILEVLGDAKVDLSTEEQSKAGERHATDLAAKVKDYQAKHPEVSYKDALVAVAPNGTEPK